jgi:mono/diheme cytochrome c family protein
MKFILVLLAALAAWAPGEAAGGDLARMDIGAGRKLHVVKCAKCHKLHEPKGYSETDWQRWMGSMSRKSKLTAAQEELLRWYLDEYRAGRIPKVK